MRQLLGVSAAAVLSAGASGQELLWERTGQPGASMLGLQVVILGDVNGDGFEDLLHLVPTWDNSADIRGAIPQEDQLWILSGRDGQTLSTRGEWAPQRPYHVIAATGDMDGDGVPDYADSVLDLTNSTFLNPVVEVRGGRDHSLIWQVMGPGPRDEGFGARMLGNLDIDGDSRLDFVIGAPFWQPSSLSPRLGRIYAYDNRGRLVYRIDGTPQLGLGAHGWNEQGMGLVGDVDRDGCDDFVLGGYDYANGLGAAILMSGRDGRILHVGNQGRTEAIGYTADGVGDIDGDGTPDFAGGSLSTGLVEAFSGRTGQLLRSWTNAGSCLRGGGLDHDVDGVPDIVTQVVVGFQRADIQVLSGRDGTAICSVPPCLIRNCTTGYGRFVAVGQPQPGNPFPVFVVGEHGYLQGYNGFPLGRLRMFRATPAGVSVYSSACRGTLPAPPRMGLRDLGTSGVRLHLSNASPGHVGALLLGLSRTQLGNGTPLPLSLTPLGFPGCFLHTSLEVLFSVPVGTTGLDRGYAFVDLPLPLALPGRESFALHGQWLALGSGANAPGALSEPMRWLH